MTAKARLSHIALPARSPRDVAAFYHDLLGLEVTVEGTLPPMGDFVFLSDRPAEVAQTLTLMTRAESKHTAWEVESLAALKQWYAEAKGRGAHVDFALNHRVSLSLYLHDPEGNGVEVFWATGLTAAGMYAEPFDLAQLDQPDDATLAILRGPVTA
ncbi:MAG: VOC family protein [Ktedonobacterales bacterium]